MFRRTGPSIDPLVARVRWVVVGVVALNALLTLAGQPASFWSDATTALRADGLPISAATNPRFDFFLGGGALPFLACTLCYFAAVALLVPRLPRPLALVAMGSLLFAHGYEAQNWLVVRLHFGPGIVVALCGVVLGVLLSFAVLPTTESPRRIVNAWRWIMVATLFVDFACTLLGQPAAYWHDPAAMREANALSRVFLGRGWAYFLALDVVLAAGQFALVTLLPVPVAFVTAFALIFGSFVGAANWFFYEWRLGWIAPIGYGAILSTLLAWLSARAGTLKEKPAAQ